MNRSIRLTDPVYVEKDPTNPIDRVALSMINDRRDLPFVHLIISASLVMIPFIIVLYVVEPFRWWLGLAYILTNFLVFFDRYVLMLHNTSHRRLFKREYKVLNHYIPMVLGPIFGQSPYTYYAHHVGMHHPENNLPEDISSTMQFQRDKLSHFLMYFAEFFFAGIFELTRYHWKRSRRKLLRMTVLGEAAWYAVVLGLLFLNWQATLTVLIIPFVLCRFLMMAGNWVQHAFIGADPANPYQNSITCINTRYNRRCFNDGYHIGHHVKANRHWTEMPVEFQENLDRYRDEGAVIFEGVDYFQIWLMLMTKRYGWIANHFVDLQEEKRSKEEVIAHIRDRLKPATMPA